MVNIWDFCLQTATVSLVAALLLLVKRLLADKLSPRWQYGIWAILALRILIPATTARNLIPRLGIWLETAKAVAEEPLASAYTAVFEPIAPAHVLPIVKGTPISITDWLFVIYAAGVILTLGWHLCSYISLRLRLRRGKEVSAAMAEKLANVRLRHWIRPWKTMEVEGISSAFVCGVFRPVLVIPAGQDIDEKVLLHELLHLKYRDALQSVLWTALRCLHWCNPFLHYIFDRIGNDMESLCDQRVLERLEGEERREYGRLLLTMANERYARAPGTTSISNGGRNIARRIEAIVRFKKYPRGMALVSVCIALVLLSPVLVGSAATFDDSVLQPQTAEDLPQAMAAARVQRCSTVAGAIDTYAKGILNENGTYIAIASPISQHPRLQAQMAQNSPAWHMDPGYGLEYLYSPDAYGIYDMRKNDDGSFNCYVTFSVTGYDDPAHQDWETTVDGVEILRGTTIIPLRIFRDGNAWVVEEGDARILSNIRFDQTEYYGEDMPYLTSTTVKCRTGTVTISHRSEYRVNNTITTNDLFGWTSYDYSLNPDAAFDSATLSCHIDYQFDPDCGLAPEAKVEVRVMEQTSLEDPVPFPVEGTYNLDYFGAEEYDEASGGTNQGYSFKRILVDEDWDGLVEMGHGGGVAGDLEDDPVPTLPEGYSFQILFDGKMIEEFTVEVLEHD